MYIVHFMQRQLCLILEPKWFKLIVKKMSSPLNDAVEQVVTKRVVSTWRKTELFRRDRVTIP